MIKCSGSRRGEAAGNRIGRGVNGCRQQHVSLEGLQMCETGLSNHCVTAWTYQRCFFVPEQAGWEENCSHVLSHLLKTTPSQALSPPSLLEWGFPQQDASSSSSSSFSSLPIQCVPPPSAQPQPSSPSLSPEPADIGSTSLLLIVIKQILI